MNEEIIIKCPKCKTGYLVFNSWNDPGTRLDPPDSGCDLTQQTCDCDFDDDYEELVENIEESFAEGKPFKLQVLVDRNWFWDKWNEDACKAEGCLKDPREKEE